MTDTPAHTPLPWAAQPLETGDDAGVSIIGSDLGGLVCASLPWPSEIDSGDYSRVESNAANFSIRACNSHYQLVEAAKAIMPRNLNLADWLPDDATIPLDVPVSELRALAAALSQAGGASD